MKKYLIVLILALCYYSSPAQVNDYKVVFDMSSRDSISQLAVIREVDLIKSGNPDAKLEVVVYGAGMNLVLKDKSIQPEGIQKILAMKDVTVKVCSLTLKRNNVDKSQLIPGVEVVPDGIYEIITKQKEGWGYIKVAH
ncbi:MAG TPA: DsrE family protein [Ferruginibacter sp.]|nr:DsrE family protein [Ferruginibacter sp.]